MKLVKLSALLLAAPVAAAAGTLEPVMEEPIMMEPAPVLTYGGDWTGGYAGLSVGASDISTDTGLDGDGSLYGAHIGYDYDFGSYVMGAELDYQAADIDVGDGAATIDSVARLKLRAGYDAGRTLVYLTGGAAKADTSLGDADGWLAGVGVDYKVTENVALGMELLHHRFDDAADSGIDVEANTLSLRASYRF